LVKIRLQRKGAKKKPYYHVVVADSRTRRDGRNIDVVGFYNPVSTNEETQVKLDAEKILHWYRRGAQPTETVQGLIKKQGIELTTK